jgi:hypothetical protein
MVRTLSRHCRLLLQLIMEHGSLAVRLYRKVWQLIDSIKDDELRLLAENTPTQEVEVLGVGVLIVAVLPSEMACTRDMKMTSTAAPESLSSWARISSALSPRVLKNQMSL